MSVFSMKLYMTSLIVMTSGMTSPLDAVTCDKGRGYGDKWFDGCQWCVCLPAGPVCSPAGCPDLVSQIPPCENLWARWTDGCYQCTCNVEGIECIVDPECLQPVLEGRVKVTGSCLDSEDERCVCGLDGVPSCSGEVIDRSAFLSTTVDLTVGGVGLRHDNPVEFVWRRHGNRGKTLERLERRMTRNELDSLDHQDLIGWRGAAGREGEEGRRDTATAGSMGDYQDFLSPMQIPSSVLVASNNRCRFGDRWYGGSLRCLCDEDNSVTCGGPAFVSMMDGFRFEKDVCEEGLVWERGPCQECACLTSGMMLCRRSCPLPFMVKPIIADNLRREGEDSHPNDKKRTQNGSADLKLERKILDLIGNKASDVITNKPSYRQPIESTNDLVLNPGDQEDSLMDKSSGARNIQKKSNRHKKRRFISGRKITRYIARPESRPPFPRPLDSSRPHTTLVRVLECRPRRKWLDGCKTCHCDSRGRRRCDDSHCLKAELVTVATINVVEPNKHRGGLNANSRPVWRPPLLAFNRTKPVKDTHVQRQRSMCGKYKVGEKYMSDCNLCVCERFGPKCTAKNCG